MGRSKHLAALQEAAQHTVLVWQAGLQMTAQRQEEHVENAHLQ